ncbi:MAG TPA: DUF2135 domain-containing protein [Spirochaetota bacterium]
MINKLAYTLTLILFSALSSSGAEIVIDSPKNGFSTQFVYLIKGHISGYSQKSAVLVLNGLPQTMPLKNNEFSLKAVAAPGNNVVEIQADDARAKVSFYAKVPSRDIKVLLTWDTPSFVDLWVIDPKGEKCYWAQPITRNGGNLVYDDSTFAPQTFTMAKAMAGTYTIQIQNYGSFGNPVSRVRVYLVLYEGTPREERREWQFVATKEQTVYHIGDFQIDAE